MDSSMELMDVICIGASVAVCVMGYLEKKDGKLIGRKDMDEYTPESVYELSQKEGPLYIVIAVFGLLAGLSGQFHFLPTALYWAAIGLVIVGIVIDAILIKKILVKKDKFKNVDLHRKLK